jgi:hypothetical protein
VTGSRRACAADSLARLLPVLTAAGRQRLPELLRPGPSVLRLAEAAAQTSLTSAPL